MGLFATAGLPVLPAAPDLLAIAVGNTNEGESLPAKPAGGVQRGQLLELLSRKLPYHDRGRERRQFNALTKFRVTSTAAQKPDVSLDTQAYKDPPMNLLVHDNGRGLGRHNGVNTWVFHHQENETNPTMQFLHRDKRR